MVEIRQTEHFAKWFKKLRDRAAKVRILSRIRRLSLGNPGLVEAVGRGVSELKIDHGPGYRIYFVRRDGDLVILLAGGDKRSQSADIQKAIRLSKEV